MANRLRAAVLGAGKIAELGHLPGYARAGVDVVALCGTDTNTLHRLCDQFQIKRRYTDWREMLDDGGFDAISICTPPSLHCEMAVASAQHGFQVLVEKPMAPTLAECDQMVNAARGAGTLLMISHNQRFSARHLIAKSILDSGRLGRPYVAQSAFAHGGPENWSPTHAWYFAGGTTPQGVMADLGSHKVDLLRWLLGQEVLEVSTFSATFEKVANVEDSAAMILRFSGGVLATVYVSWAQRPAMADSITIQCEKGTLIVPTDASEPVRVLEAGEGGAISESTYAFTAEDGPGWYATAGAFVDAIMNNKPSPVSGEEGRATMAAIIAAYEAALEQRVVSVSHQ